MNSLVIFTYGILFTGSHGEKQLGIELGNSSDCYGVWITQYGNTKKENELHCVYYWNAPRLPSPMFIYGRYDGYYNGDGHYFALVYELTGKRYIQFRDKQGNTQITQW